MAIRRGTVEQDFIIERVRERFQCRVLWSEGRPCLEYSSDDVFFTAVESLPSDD
ncbi:hypothetical protein SAMN04488542_13232 [Fontibacillus panacisegetis]|uniref:Uncharacterized protein n=1 Tax=Fontibacillus panacisegetis TaxID=670482 RepID=A0A1G7SVK5_9BACL|nr:hypothetical protein [Fontibacillus panacisegetis]SDG27001.1 hypothetical protein SAMN04488542_13232 [Fontibacillus panacisegetis]